MRYEAFIAELQAPRIVADAESAARIFNGVHRLALDHRLPPNLFKSWASDIAVAA